MTIITKKEKLNIAIEQLEHGKRCCDEYINYPKDYYPHVIPQKIAEKEALEYGIQILKKEKTKL